MIDLGAIISRVESLLEQGTPASATYAALECRLAIEKVCYDRLRIAHDYISQNDLRRWKPQDVIATLLLEVDDHIGSNSTMSISARPVNSHESPNDGDLLDQDWVTIGTQIGIDHKKLGKLWHSLSNVALHVVLPATTQETIPNYGDHQKILRQVEEALIELKSLSRSTLQISGIGSEISLGIIPLRQVQIEDTVSP